MEKIKNHILNLGFFKGIKIKGWGLKEEEGDQGRVRRLGRWGLNIIKAYYICVYKHHSKDYYFVKLIYTS